MKRLIGMAMVLLLIGAGCAKDATTGSATTTTPAVTTTTAGATDTTGTSTSSSAVTTTTSVTATTTVSEDEEPEWVQSIYALREGVSYVGTCQQVFRFSFPQSEIYRVQGGYFDGKQYVVAIVHKGNDGYETVKLLRLDTTGKVMDESESLALDHANNITYNTTLDRWLISHCQSPDGHYNRYSLVDPNTFTITKTADLEAPFFSMAYSPEKDRYASARWDGETIDIWDGNLNLLKTVDVERPQSLSQGVFCDEKGIYFVRSDLNGSGSEIRIYDWEANLVRIIPFNVGGGIEEIDAFFYR